MNELEAIRARHSVRRYLDRSIEPETRRELNDFVARVNEESGLNITVCYDDPEGFDSRLARYGSFRNVNSYIVLKGDKCPDFSERCGYYGEMIVLKAQMLGLNTCWAALTFNKKKVKTLVPDSEEFCMVISVGYGETQGKPHRGKTREKVTNVAKGPDWFEAGVEAALLAPTAVNQQKFRIELDGETPLITVAGLGTYTKVDLGIIKYHFAVASGRKTR